MTIAMNSHNAMLNPALFTLFFQGCDASVLLNGRKKNNGEAEKEAAPNLTLRGFAFLDGAKALVEEECPGVVSCADVLALAARDAVAAIGGPFWKVPTGRRDGRVSRKQEALDQIPAPTMNFTALLASFRSKGLELPDLVWLSGDTTKLTVFHNARVVISTKYRCEE